MEPLTDPPEPNADKPKQKAPDRATLGKSEADKVDAWLKQVNESSKGFLTLTRSDAINFLIREHKAELAPREIQRLRADNYDPIKHITWITPQIKAALTSGDLVRVADLQHELRGVELSVIETAKTTVHGGSNSKTDPPRSSRRRKSTTASDDHSSQTNDDDALNTL